VRALVIGTGAVGARVARTLGQHDDVDEVVAGRDFDARARADVVVLATPSARHAGAAAEAIRAGCHVVSVADGVEAVRDLLELDPEARERGRTIAVGAGFSPGLSCVLVRHAATALDAVDEVHVSRIGTGGPACARQHHSALGGTTLDWRDHGWHRRPAGTGRELCWFPDPIGAADCYRAALPDALLLVPAFPAAARVTARLAATRRDRFTTWLPMLRRPHPEGGLGAVRVEVRGRRAGTSATEVLGAIDRPAAAAASVAALVARLVVQGRVERAGAAGLATLVDPLPFLHELAHVGVKAAVFEGTA
jgi:saccharopine dehydrogenase-like NADP-dependent oxidoreductase